MQNVLKLKPKQYASGSLQPPGSKSISNRVLPLAAVSLGNTEIKNLPNGEDVELMQKALKALGVSMENQGGLKIYGLGRPFQSEHPLALHLGNSGTCMRTLTAFLSCSQGEFFLDGVPRMRERPIGHLVEAIRRLNSECKIECPEKDGFPPVKIISRGLTGGQTEISGEISSQFTTALLLSLPLATKAGRICIVGKQVSRPYIDMTLQIMKQFGVEVKEKENAFEVEGEAQYRAPGTITIEPDASSASYFLAAGAIARGPVTVKGLSQASLQGESGFAKVLEKMGANVTWSEEGITVSGGNLKGIEMDMDTMTDTGMTLAMTAMFAEGKTIIKNIGNWRHKETDRIDAMSTELTKLGATIENGKDYLVIDPPVGIKPATIATYDDHRMAMCFSLACLGGVEVNIENPGCANKTYPAYFRDFQSILC